jgi:hypothetical protein
MLAHPVQLCVRCPTLRSVFRQCREGRQCGEGFPRAEPPSSGIWHDRSVVPGIKSQLCAGSDIQVAEQLGRDSALVVNFP